MRSWVNALYLEQTTPDEVLIFLLLGSVVALLVAFVLYAGILVLLWRLRGPRDLRIRTLLFPPPELLRRYAAEYVLAGVTAFLLTLVVVARHDVVSTVLDQPLGPVLEEGGMGAIMPLGPPTEEELMGAGASAAEARAAAAALRGEPGREGDGDGLIAVRALLASLLDAGLVDNASTLVSASMANVEEGIRGVLLDRDVLLVVAMILLLAYVGWFGWTRSREIGRDGDTGPRYGQIARRLAVPALCIPLLLASAIAVEDGHRIERSVLAASVASLDEPTTSLLREVVRDQAAAVRVTVPVEEMTTELGRLRVLADSDRVALAGIRGRLSELRGQVGQASRRLEALERGAAADRSAADAAHRDLEARLGEVSGTLERLTRRVDAVSEESRRALRAAMVSQEQLEGLAGRLPALSQAIDRMDGRIDALEGRLPRAGIVFIVTAVPSRYTVRRNNANGPIVARGTSVGLHQLAPGSYHVAGAGAVVPAPFRVQAGSAATVRLESSVPAVQ